MEQKSKFTLAVLSALPFILVWAAISAGGSGKDKRRMINRSTPILHVKKVEPSVQFWTERFGFKTTIQVPEDDHIGFVALESGTIELMYQTYAGMKADAANPLAQLADQGPSFVFMEVSDINAVAEALKGTQVVQGIHDTAYGAKEIIVKEPGGHIVIFSQLPQR